MGGKVMHKRQHTRRTAVSLTADHEKRLHAAKHGHAHVPREHHLPLGRYVSFILLFGAVLVVFLLLILPVAISPADQFGCEVSQTCNTYCKQLGLSTGNCKVVDERDQYDWLVCACVT
ncbi:MAG: hypothetical protein V1725_07975 [archaeon]